MATTDDADARADVDATARLLLEAYRVAIADDGRQLDWLSRSLLLHMVARGSRVAATRLVITTDVPSGDRLKVFADEVVRADPFARLSAIPRILVHATPYVALPVALAALLWELGGRINAYPGTYGLVIGGIFVVGVAGNAAWRAYLFGMAHVMPAYDILKKRVDDLEQLLFAALHHNRPRRPLGYALAVAWGLLWIVVLGLVAAGFIVGHWGGRGPRSTGDITGNTAWLLAVSLGSLRHDGPVGQPCRGQDQRTPGIGSPRGRQCRRQDVIMTRATRPVVQLARAVLRARD